ncbi:MAG: phosphomannomutase/phosphoglucomutase [Deltaproteobacteria bacterium]|nr:phosphomannomutase/phosphoglucomutase [Deltaproteobacteria bacterium]
MNPFIFKEYDIRGVYEKDLTEDVVRDLGRAVGSYLSRYHAVNVSVGRDCRLSSPAMAGRIVEALAGSGLHVTDLGTVPSPVFYYSLFHLDADGGAMVTASHNPAEYNGMKVAMGKSTIYGDEIQELCRMIKRGEFVSGRGSVKHADVVTPYIEHCAGNIKPGPRKIKVVVDAGNGTGGVIALPIMQKLGFDVVPLFIEMDGRFPNHHPDPTVPKNLEKLISTVKDTKADLGISYDGDADRLGVVDEKGGIIWGDQLMIVFSRAILAEKPGAKFIAEVKCSKTLYEDIPKHGGQAIMWRTGHSLIKAKMKEEHADLAGEMSGHIFFAHRYFGYDDAIYSSLRLLEILSKTDKTMSDLLSDVPPTHSTPEIRMDCPDETKFKVVEKLVSHFKGAGYNVVDVDGARVTFPDGWGLVRASNTQPVLVLRFEADTEPRLRDIRSLIMEKLRELM